MVGYESDNPSVATVVDNVVTMHSIGVVTITAVQPGDANYFAAEPVDQSFQIVNETRIIDLSTSALLYTDVIIGRSATLTLTVTNTGSAALDVTDIQYPEGISVSDADFMVPSNGSITIDVTYTPTAEGQLNGTLTIQSNATSGSNSVQLQGTAVLITDAEAGADHSFTVYPNPANDHVLIQYVSSGKIAEAHIIDLTGRNVMASQPASVGPRQYLVDVSVMPSGTYVMKGITSQGTVYFKRFVKK